MRALKLISISMISAFVAACGGGGGSSAPAPVTLAPTPVPQTVSSVTLSGKVTYDRVYHTQSSGLDYSNIDELPIRGVVIDALDNQGTVIKTTISDDDGSYSFTLDADTQVRIQIKAQLLSTSGPQWDFQVTDNTQYNSLYVLQGSLASTGSAAQQTRDLHAPIGWTGSAYTEERSAAPFAILDSVYSAVEVFTVADPNIDFPPLELRWSTGNKATAGDRAYGYIGSSSYVRDGAGGAIYILGEEDRDTDEYDAHVIVHEWAHYFEHQLSRTDSIGGQHALNNRLDPRLALSEGWGNALSAIVTGDPIYRDSSGTGQKFGFSFSLESHNIDMPGWFNEASIGSIIYDIVDDNSDSLDADNISVGLKPIYNVMMSGAYKDASEFTTIFSLIDGLRSEGSISQSDINALLTQQSIYGDGPDGSGESNNGSISSILPVYKTISLNGPSAQICSRDDAGLYNKLGNREFLLLSLNTETAINLTAMKTSGDDERDPDFNIWQAGTLLHESTSSGANQETFTGTLSAGDYVVEAYDFNNISGTGSKRGDSCFDFTITG